MPDNCLLIKVISQCWYSWVENYSSFSRTHVARSTEPHLARFFILICREHKNMSCAFSGTVSPCYLFWHRRPSIAEYKTWLTYCSEWQFFCFSVCLWYQGRVHKKNCRWNPSGRQLSTIFAGGISISGLRGTFSSIAQSTMETKTCQSRTISDSSTRSTFRWRFTKIRF